jgi:hypothetical protein
MSFEIAEREARIGTADEAGTHQSNPATHSEDSKQAYGKRAASERAFVCVVGKHVQRSQVMARRFRLAVNNGRFESAILEQCSIREASSDCRELAFDGARVGLYSVDMPRKEQNACQPDCQNERRDDD